MPYPSNSNQIILQVCKEIQIPKNEIYTTYCYYYYIIQHTNFLLWLSNKLQIHKKSSTIKSGWQQAEENIHEVWKKWTNTTPKTTKENKRMFRVNKNIPDNQIKKINKKSMLNQCVPKTSMFLCSKWETKRTANQRQKIEEKKRRRRMRLWVWLMWSMFG